VVDRVAHRIPRKFGISPRNIQVLAPMHRGPAAAGALAGGRHTRTRTATVRAQLIATADVRPWADWVCHRDCASRP